MSTSHSFCIKSRTGLGKDEIRVLMDQITGTMPFQPNPTFHLQPQVAEYLPLSPALLEDMDPQGWSVENDRFQAAFWTTNLSWELDPDEAEVFGLHPGASRDVLLQSVLSQICTDEPGTILGVWSWDHLDMPSPIVMTDQGLRYAIARDDEEWTFRMRQPAVTVPDRIPAHLVIAMDGKYATIDIDGLRRHLAEQETAGEPS